MFFNGFNSETERINKIIDEGAFDEGSFFKREINEFLASPKRFDMLLGEKYYNGRQDILKRKRTVIGEGGELSEVDNLPNNKIVDNQYAKMVDQKINYLLAKPITYCCENKELLEKIKNILGRKFARTLKAVGEDSLNGGIGWLYIFINEKGEIDFKRFKPYDIIPLWRDSDHTALDCCIRLYTKIEYTVREKKVIKMAEVYNSDCFSTYIIEGGGLKKIGECKNYFYRCFGKRRLGFGWGKVPLIPFKQNSKEIPLIKRVKSLQDALNVVRSDFLNNMQEDNRNTILVIKNYDGTDLGEFRRNLSQYGAVKVRTIDGADGGIDTLKIEVNSDNYIAISDMLKKAIIENARGFDPRDERFNSNPNQMNILSMYSDIDLDANGMETEYQAAFEEVFYFVKKYLAEKGEGDFKEDIQAVFNKDQLINESEVIENCLKSKEILSLESVISQHPWVDDVYKEMEKRRAEE